MTITKYGIMSDIHEDPNIAKLAVDKLKEAGANKLILNGDIGIHAGYLQGSQRHTAIILDAVARSGLESYVQPGSHETIEAYEPIIELYSGRFSNVIDAIKNPKIDFGSHQMVFLPGSDWVAGGQYRFGNQFPSGDYFITDHHEYISAKRDDELKRLSEAGKIIGFTNYKNINDIGALVTDPYKTVVVCHVPRKFDDVEIGIDMAEFGQPKEAYHIFDVMFKDGKQGTIAAKGDLREDEVRDYLSSKNVEKITNHHSVDKDYVFPMPVALQYEKMGVPIEMKKENRGNEALRELYNSLGITKAVSGHFHESSHRAHDSNGIFVPQNTFVNDLFWNSGQLDKGYTGILTVDGDQVSYQNIKIR